MKPLILLLAFAAALSAAPAFAEDGASPATQTASVQPEPRSEAPTRDGQYVGALCSKADPYIEYRDCVNAATRDQNAKVRDA